jgi:hypothetical protein
MKAAPAQLRFDYGALDTETRIFVEERTERIHNLARMTATGIVQIGQYLTEVKARLEHGRFLEWIDREFAWSQQSASRFMQVHEQFKLRNLGNLQIDVSALYLIAAPSTPEPVRTEMIRQAELGEKVTHATVKAVVAEYKKTGDAPEAIDKLFEAVRTAQQQDTAERKLLPSPAEARRIAIETGAHTLDRNGTYQPPMTVEQQEAWRADLRRISPILDFIRWVSGTDGLDVGEVVKIIDARWWRKDFDRSAQAAAWLTDFTAELICQKSKALKN